MERGAARHEILRYLGRRGQAVPEEIMALIDASWDEMLAAARPRRVSGEFALGDAGDGLHLEGAGLTLPGADIRRHLTGCGRAVLLAATLGPEADALIRRWERADLTRSLVLDACATTLVEAVCDEAEAAIRAEAEKAGQGVTGRFSPGYGDLPLGLQPGILTALNAGRRIGLTCTDSLILLPRKSVTAIMGIGETGDMQGGSDARGCAGCALRDRCTFRKEAGDDGCQGYQTGAR